MLSAASRASSTLCCIANNKMLAAHISNQVNTVSGHPLQPSAWKPSPYADILWTSRVAAAHGAIALSQQPTPGQVYTGCVTFEVRSISLALQHQYLPAATDSVLHDLREQVS